MGFWHGWRLRRNGVLGINRRNAECLLERNPRPLYPLVDDKLLMRDLCLRLGIATPTIHHVFRHHRDSVKLLDLCQQYPEIVIKPCRGSGGRGVMILLNGQPDGWQRPNGQRITVDELQFYLSEILAGMYSLGGTPDCALVQERIRLHPDFRRISYKGIPDVRVVLHRGEPVMAMLRLPTMESNGRANLHQGGIGVGIDLLTGYTHHAIHRNRQIDRHPDTGERLRERLIPDWPNVLQISRKIARAVGLGFLGIDIVIEPERGPMLLEANARPGLTIQLANRAGLLRPMHQADRS